MASQINGNSGYLFYGMFGFNNIKTFKLNLTGPCEGNPPMTDGLKKG